MDKALYDQISPNVTLRLAPPLVTLTGTPVPVSGQGEFQLNNMCMNVIVSSSMGVPLLIGTDMLERHSGMIDYENNVVIMGGNKYMFVSQPTAMPGVAEVVPQLDIDGVTSDYDDLFYNDQRGLTEATGLAPMRIETTGEPIYQRPYRAALTKRHIIEEAIDEMLADGVIEPSRSPWASPVLLTPKKGGEWRFCVDYRAVNAITKKDRFPLPYIQDIFDTVGVGRVFSTLDLKSGYWQLPVAEADREKTAFVCHRGQYQYNRVSFGLTNAPAHFQRAMNQVLAPLLGVCVLVYIDDIVVFSKTPTEHMRHLQAVFDLLRGYNLQLKRSKCEFGKTQVELLGYRINARGIAPLPEKTEAIEHLPPPRDVGAVRRFLGMANFYRQCVPDYARVAEPIVRLTRKGVEFEWTAAQERAFAALKALLVSPAVMAHPDVRRPYKLFTDACDHAIGGILCQVDDEGIERVVQYISHQLNPVQRRWATIEKEAYAVVYALQKLRPYLLGAEFVVYTDHKPLKSLFTREMNNTKIQRWSVLLAEYGATIEYRKGKNNIRADMLSRITSSSMTEPLPIAVITRSMADPVDEALDHVGTAARYGLSPSAVRAAQLEEFPTLIEEAIYDEDSDYTYTEKVLRSERLPYKGAEWMERIVLPTEFHQRVIKQAHTMSGHSGTIKTMKRLQEDFVWEGMRRGVRHFVSACGICQAYHTRRPRTTMQEVEIPPTPMQHVGVDFVGPFVEDPVGCKYLFTVIDYTSGWAEAFRTQGTTTGEVIDTLVQEFFPRHGVPRILVADNASCFTSRAWGEFIKETGIEMRHSTPYHPQGNSRVERFNGTLKRLIAKACKNRPADWYLHVNAALMAYRTSVNEATGYTPFYLLYGRRAQVPIEPFLDAGPNAFGNRLDDLAAAYREARANQEVSRKYNRRQLAARANVDTSLRVGDTVTIKAEEAITNSARWDPQYQIIRVEGSTHWLRHQVTGKERKVHREKLTLVDPDIGWGDLPPRPRRQRPTAV